MNGQVSHSTVEGRLEGEENIDDILAEDMAISAGVN